MIGTSGLKVDVLQYSEAVDIVVLHHYMHRKPPISFAFGIKDGAGDVLGCVTFGTPGSRHLIVGACPNEPESVIELNRLWCDDVLPKNTESWFLSQAISMMPPKIILSYADTKEGHTGIVYRAANFYYAGWTDMDRKTPRFDYVSPGKHSRDAFRNGFTEKVRRKPKVKYWTVSGNRRDRKRLERLCSWGRLDWNVVTPPLEHKQRRHS